MNNACDFTMLALCCSFRKGRCRRSSSSYIRVGIYINLILSVRLAMGGSDHRARSDQVQ